MRAILSRFNRWPFLVSRLSSWSSRSSSYIERFNTSLRDIYNEQVGDRSITDLQCRSVVVRPSRPRLSAYSSSITNNSTQYLRARRNKCNAARPFRIWSSTVVQPFRWASIATWSNPNVNFFRSPRIHYWSKRWRRIRSPHWASFNTTLISSASFWALVKRILDFRFHCQRIHHSGHGRLFTAFANSSFQLSVFEELTLPLQLRSPIRSITYQSR